MTVSLRTRARLSRPSFGFFFLLGSHLLLAGLMWWGSQKPRLDSAFEILARRELNDPKEFSPEEVQLLQAIWKAHPGFGRALLGRLPVKFLEPTESGWMSRRSAHLVVRPEKGRATEFSIEGRGTPSDFPLRVKIRASGVERQVELLPNQPQKLEWSPSELKSPSILDIEVTTAQNHGAGVPAWAIRVLLPNATNARDIP